nr:MAG: hypothetical protein DIU58_17645 [Sphaerobacter thermophilus]
MQHGTPQPQGRQQWPALLTPRQAARYLGGCLGEHKIRRLAETKHLGFPAFWMGRGWVIPRASLDAWLAERARLGQRVAI